MSLESDATYYGFIRVYRSGGQIINKFNTYCSQIIRSYSNIEKVVFMFPDDWLPNRFKKDETFIKWWCNLASQWFTKVDYTGVCDGSEFGLNIEKLNNSRYKRNEIVQNNDVIRNPVWRRFEIITNKELKYSHSFNYAAFVMIRFLFCTHYKSLVDDFLNFKFFTADPTTGKKIDIDDFELFQLVHYLDTYHSTYGFKSMGVCYKIRKLKEVRDSILAGKSITNSFDLQLAGYKVEEIKNLLTKKRINEAYEKIK